MKRRRHTPEQVVRKLREAERMLGEGKTIPEVAKELEVSENTFHRWRAQYGGMKADEAKRLERWRRMRSAGVDVPGAAPQPAPAPRSTAVRPHGSSEPPAPACAYVAS